MLHAILSPLIVMVPVYGRV